MAEFKFSLGEEAKDVITGFRGIIVGRSQYMTGCHQYGLCPQKLTKEGKRPEWEWVDENRLEKIGKGIKLPEQKKEIIGFDGNHPNKQ